MKTEIARVGCYGVRRSVLHIVSNRFSIGYAPLKETIGRATLDEHFARRPTVRIYTVHKGRREVRTRPDPPPTSKLRQIFCGEGPQALPRRHCGVQEIPTLQSGTIPEDDLDSWCQYTVLPSHPTCLTYRCCGASGHVFVVQENKEQRSGRLSVLQVLYNQDKQHQVLCP